MEQNKVEIIGKVNYTEIKEHTNCKVAKFSLGKRIRDDEYKSFWVTMFNDDAVKAYGLLKKGDFAYIKGKLSISTYIANKKPIDKLEIIGFEAKKVKYDTEQRKYVEITNEEEGVADWD